MIHKFKTRKVNQVVTQEERVLGMCEGIRDPVHVLTGLRELRVWLQGAPHPMPHHPP